MTASCFATIRYHQYSGGIIFFHMVVENKCDRHFISEKLIEYALEYAKENNLKIMPLCPYMINYIHWHMDDYRCVGKIFI